MQRAGQGQQQHYSCTSCQTFDYAMALPGHVSLAGSRKQAIPDLRHADTLWGWPCMVAGDALCAFELALALGELKADDWLGCL